MDKLFFDIETVKNTVNISPEDIAAPSNYKDAAKIAEYQLKKVQELEAKAGLNSFTAKICCIGWAVNDDNPKYLVGINELELLKQFEALLPDDFIKWVGYNILSFDLPFLWHRACKYNLTKLKGLLPKDSRQFNTDVMKLVSPTDYKAMVSLKDACNFFDIPTSKDGIDGSKVQAVYDAGGLEQIGKYCAEDVRAVRDLYKLLN